MNYSVTCGCGRIRAVEATQAGSTLKCACGRSITVPLLSTLRSTAGENAIPLNTIDTIREMIRRGELPSGEVCPHSGRRADSTVYFHVQCERMWVRGNDSTNIGSTIVHFLLLGWMASLFASLKSRPLEELGRDTSLELPLRISSEVSATIMRMRRQKTLKRLLRSTPIYATLLDEFPEGAVTPLRIE
jgi:hypothetical protein